MTEVNLELFQRLSNRNTKNPTAEKVTLVKFITRFVKNVKVMQRKKENRYFLFHQKLVVPCIFNFQIIEHHKGKLAKDTYVPTTKAAEVRSVLFHDRDFDFEQTQSSNDDFWK